MTPSFRATVAALAVALLASPLAQAHSGEDHTPAPSAPLTFTEVYKEKLVASDDGYDTEADTKTSVCGKLSTDGADVSQFNAATAWHLNVNNGALDLSGTLGDSGVTASFGAKGNATVPTGYGPLQFRWTAKKVKFCLKLADHPLVAEKHLLHIAPGGSQTMSEALFVDAGVGEVNKTFAGTLRVKGKKPKVAKKNASGVKQDYYPATLRIKGTGKPT